MAKPGIALAKKAESKIQILHGHRVILDADLAALYGVSVKRLNEQVKRNAKRFPSDFLFRLSAEQGKILRSQIATSNIRRGGRRYLPYAFTEHGAVMAATVLNSKRAVDMSIFVVRAFIKMREALAANQEIVSKLKEIEQRLESHDVDLQELVAAVRELMIPPPPNSRRIGFILPSGQARDRLASRVK
ncbi:MAG TPA: ORF6N domain-containing protein [Terriglobales bacterium]|nr:ORF6N domain-containing protein [Terriglobales bacterium]